jgi:hypothetical protein
MLLQYPELLPSIRLIDLTVNPGNASLTAGLDPVFQYRRYVYVTDRFSRNSVGGK